MADQTAGIQTYEDINASSVVEIGTTAVGVVQVLFDPDTGQGEIINCLKKAELVILDYFAKL